MAILEEPTFPGFDTELMCSAPECLANRVPLPGSEEARAMTVGSGRQLSMLLDQSSPLGRFSRILLESLAWTNSREFSYVWNRLDTRFELSAFQLTPLGQSIEDNGCSLFATPQAHDCHDGNPERVGRFGTKHGGRNLADEVKLWPTPVSTEGRGCSRMTHKTPEARSKAGWTLTATAKLWPTPTVPNGGRRNPEGTSITGRKPDGGKAQIDLREFAIRLWPTPTERDWKSTSHGNQGNARLLSEVAGLTSKTSGSLNPRFVEELMGFPIDHTALKHSATPLSRNKRSHSSRQSRKLNKLA